MHSILRFCHFYGFEFVSLFKVFNSFLRNINFLCQNLFMYKMGTLIALNS